MGVCLDNSRRNYHYYCKYYKKKDKNDSSLEHEKEPSGYFYARVVKDEEKDSQEIVGSIQVGYEEITIETPDNVKIDKNDVVYFDNYDWLVENVIEREITKRKEFSSKVVKRKVITLRK